MPKLNFPSSPTAGQQYKAHNGVTYTWDDTIGIGVWTAKVTVEGQFPNLPASLVTGPTEIPGAVSGTWADGSTSLISTGCLQISLDNVTFGTGPLSINNGDTLYERWDPAGASCGGAAHGTTITGTLEDGTYTNTYTLTIDKQPSFTLPADPTGAAFSTQQTTNTLTPNNFNCPVTVSFTNPTTGGSVAMSNVQYVINGGAAVNVTLGTTIVVLNPGDDIEILGDTGATSGTAYGLTVTMGAAAAQEWLVTTTGATSAIQAPVMSPTGGPLNPGLNSPAGITIGGGTYTVASGAPGLHTSTDWELYEGGYPLGPSTATISGVTPGTAGTPGTVPVKDTGSADPNPALAQNAVYGKIPQDNALAAGQPAGTYPMFEWINGVNTGGGINGYSDWYIPARNEFFILYFFLKPDGTTNVTHLGSNPNSVAPYTPNTNFGPGFPDPANTPTLFQSGNGQALTAGFYWSSTENSGNPVDVWSQTFDNGSSTAANKINPRYARAIRRIPIADYTAAGSPAIGTYLAGGFYAGQISTAGNGTADYALIVAPNAQGTYGSSGTNASLSIAGADTDGFAVGMTIKGNTSSATGVILSINGTTIEYLSTSGTFVTGETISTDPASYTQTVPPPANPNSTDLETLLVPQSSLTVSSTYYSRARYSASSTSTTSPWANWASFTTTSSFAISPGTAMGGGYFAGQINDGGTVYNLIVAPVEGNTTGPATGGALKGQYGGTTPSGIKYNNANIADLPAATSQNEVYGAGATTTFADAAHPVFDWCVNDVNGPNGSGGIGGFTDWYIPAKNELAVLYFSLKPNSTANNTSSGSNPNSVAPYTPNTNYGPGFPNISSNALFAGGAQAFSTAIGYWASTEDSNNTPLAWIQNFNSGLNYTVNKDSGVYARAVRRINA